MRVIEGIPVDRARIRFTVAYSVTERFTLGLEANPKDDDYGPIANYRLLDETEFRPAIVLGTSSDRIGTPSGRSYYAMAAKDLNGLIGDTRPAARQLQANTLPQAEAAIRDLRSTTKSLRDLTEKVNSGGAGSLLGGQKLPDYKPRGN